MKIQIQSGSHNITPNNGVQAIGAKARLSLTPDVVREKMNELEENRVTLPRGIHSAVLTLSAIAIMLACIILLTVAVIIPVNQFVPGVGEIDAPDAVVILELAFILLVAAGITGLFLRWVRKQTGSARQRLQVLGVLVLLIALEFGIFTFFGMIIHGACKDRTTRGSRVPSTRCRVP